MKLKPSHWGVWAIGGVVSFAVLETLGYQQGVTLTSRIRRWRDSHPVARAALTVALGAGYAWAVDHLLHDDGGRRSPPDRARESGL